MERDEDEWTKIQKLAESVEVLRQRGCTSVEFVYRSCFPCQEMHRKCDKVPTGCSNCISTNRLKECKFPMLTLKSSGRSLINSSNFEWEEAQQELQKIEASFATVFQKQFQDSKLPRCILEREYKLVGTCQSQRSPSMLLKNVAKDNTLFLYCNEEWHSLFGYSLRLAGRPITDVIPKGIVQQVMQGLDQIGLRHLGGSRFQPIVMSTQIFIVDEFGNKIEVDVWSEIVLIDEQSYNLVTLTPRPVQSVDPNSYRVSISVMEYNLFAKDIKPKVFRQTLRHTCDAIRIIGPMPDPKSDVVRNQKHRIGAKYRKTTQRHDLHCNAGNRSQIVRTIFDNSYASSSSSMISSSSSSVSSSFNAENHSQALHLQSVLTDPSNSSWVPSFAYVPSTVYSSSVSDLHFVSSPTSNPLFDYSSQTSSPIIESKLEDAPTVANRYSSISSLYARDTMQVEDAGMFRDHKTAKIACKREAYMHTPSPYPTTFIFEHVP